LVALTSKATAIPAKDYTWFVHALDSKGALVSQDDRPPLVPTSGWRPGEEHKDWFSLPAPSAPGAELEIGAYDAAGGRVVFRLSNGETSDHLIVPIDQRLLTSRPNS